jgi:hypothetical protein
MFYFISKKPNRLEMREREREREKKIREQIKYEKKIVRFLVISFQKLLLLF